MNLEEKKSNEENIAGNNNLLKTLTVPFSNKKSEEPEPLSEYWYRKEKEKEEELKNSFCFGGYF